MAEYLPAQMESVHKPRVEPEGPTKKERAPAAHPLLSLQARAGNQAVARMVQRAGPDEEELPAQAKHDPSLQREDEGAEMEDEEPIQPKHDPALQREEQASDEEENEEVQAKHDPSLQRMAENDELQAKHDPALQRAVGEDEMQMKRDESPRVGLEGGPVGPDVEQRISSMRGGGSAAPEGIRRQMEAATGTNLSGVRVHEGAEANSLNHQLTAKAFTTGNDIFLRGDQSAGDSSLMAHEMAHVIQQSSGRTSASGEMSAGAANDPLEAEADSLAHAVLSGQTQPHADEARV